MRAPPFNGLPIYIMALLKEHHRSAFPGYTIELVCSHYLDTPTAHLLEPVQYNNTSSTNGNVCQGPASWWLAHFVA